MLPLCSFEQCKTRWIPPNYPGLCVCVSLRVCAFRVPEEDISKPQGRQRFPKSVLELRWDRVRLELLSQSEPRLPSERAQSCRAVLLTTPLAVAISEGLNSGHPENQQLCLLAVFMTTDLFSICTSGDTALRHPHPPPPPHPTASFFP